MTTEEFLQDGAIGQDAALRQANAFNIFYDYKRSGERITCLLNKSKASELVRIKGISLHSLVKDNKIAQSFRQAVKRGVRFNILIIDPQSEQAKIRALREYAISKSLPLEGEVATAELNQLKLYRDTRATIEALKGRFYGLKKVDNVDVRLFSSAPEALLFITNEFAMVEPYHYGKIEISEGDDEETLGGDVPAWEFRNFDKCMSPLIERDVQRNPYALYVNSFDYVFEHCSSPISD